MSGIVSYYHGEKGDVVDRWWQPFDENRLLAFNIEIAGDPHRVWARDYDADIGIDPILQRGDAAVYLRLDDTSGIWARESDKQGRKLNEAIQRVRQNRNWMERWEQHSNDTPAILALVEELNREMGEPLRVMLGELPSATPATPATFFLSYSSTDSLLAREIYEDLSTDAMVDVWFDLAQPQRFAPGQDDAIARWLEESVEGCQGFLLLLTENSLASGWVGSEIEYALAKGMRGTDRDIVILKAADVAVPDVAASVAKVVDCDGIWWSRGISEELFAAIYGREGRKAWLSRQPGTLASSGEILSYGDLGTEAGTVVSFSCSVSPYPDCDFRRKDIAWSLQYAKRSGELVHVSGGGEQMPADLDMQPGNRIAFVRLHRRCEMDLQIGLPLWMRSDDLEVTPDFVLDRYFDALEVNRTFRPTRLRAEPAGADALGRMTIRLNFQGSDGQWRIYEALAWALIRNDFSAEQLLRQLTKGRKIESD